MPDSVMALYMARLAARAFGASLNVCTSTPTIGLRVVKPSVCFCPAASRAAMLSSMAFLAFSSSSPTVFDLPTLCNTLPSLPEIPDIAV